MKIKNIARDSVVYLVGDILTKSTPFILLPFLTRGLGAEEFALYSYWVAIYLFISLFILLSQDGAIARYFFVYGKKSIGYPIISGICFSIIASVTLVLIFLIFNLLDLILLVACAFFNSLFNVQLRYRQCQKQPGNYFIIQGVASFSLLGLALGFVQFFSPTANSYFLALCIANILASLAGWLGLYLQNDVKFKFNYSRLILALKYLLALGLPTLIHQLAFIAKAQLDRIIVYKQFEPSVVASYAAGFQLASVVSVALLSINKAVTPYMYEGLKNNRFGRTEVLKASLLSLFVVMFAGVVCYVFPSDLVIFFLGSDYIEAAYYFKIFAFALSFLLPYLILTNFLFYHRRNNLIAIVSVVTAILYVALVMYLSFYDIKLVPFSLIATNLVMVVTLYFTVLKLKV